MSLKLDKFTWIVIGVVVVLLVAAVVTVNITGGRGWGTLEYRSEDTPAAAVYNAFVASVKQDTTVLNKYYTKKVLADYDQQNRGVPYYYVDDTPRRLRILQAEVQDDKTAMVTYAVDRYSTGGLFGSGTTWTNRQIIRVVREDDQWKIDTPQFNF